MWGAIAQGISSGISPWQNYRFSKSLATDDWRRYGMRHQAEVEDLRSAGLNPMLSNGASPPSPSKSGVNLGSSALPNLEESIHSAKKARAEARAAEGLADQAEAAGKNAKNQQEVREKGFYKKWITPLATGAQDLAGILKAGTGILGARYLGKRTNNYNYSSAQGVKSGANAASGKVKNVKLYNGETGEVYK